MGLYTVSVKCPHCAGSTYVDEMDTGKFRWAEALLQPVLRALTCGNCAQRFGDGGVLVRKPVAP